MSLLLVQVGSCAVAKVNAESSAKTIGIAGKLLDEDKVEQALAILNKVLSNEPDNFLALSARSRALRKSGEMQKAKIDADRAVRLAPRRAEVYLDRIPLFLESKQYSTALKESKKVILMVPTLVRAYLMRAIVYERLGQNDNVIRDCNKVISMKPDLKELADIYSLRGNAYERKGQKKLANADLKKGLTLSLKSPHPNRINRSNLYFGLKRFSDAVAECTIALKLNPKSAAAYDLRANAYNRLGQYQNEIDDLSEEIKLDPKNAELYELRANTEYDLSQLKKAIEDCQTALKLSSKSNAKWTLMDALEELGQYQEAIEFRTEFLDHGEYRRFNLARRARLYERIGRSDLAKADWKEVGKAAEAQHYKQNIEYGSASKKVVLRFSYDDESHFAVPVRIDRHEFKMMVDTGCESSDLWKASMSKLSLHPKYDFVYEKADGKKTKSGDITVHSFDIGSIKIKDLFLTVDDGIRDHSFISGFLGSDILEHFALTVNYANKTVTLAESYDGQMPPQAFAVPMILRRHCPICLIRINDKIELPALLDTGAPASDGPDALLKPVLKNKLKFSGYMGGPWLGDLKCETVRLESIGWQDNIFKNWLFDVFPAADAPDAAHELILGNDFLSQFKTVTFDYPGRRVIFEPNENQKDAGWQMMNEARFSESQNDYRATADYLEKFMSAEPELGSHYLLTHLSIYLRLKDYHRALQDSDELVRLDPKDPDLYVLRASIRHELKQYEKEIEDDNRALSIKPFWVSAYEDRSLAYDALGNKQQAASDRAKARQITEDSLKGLQKYVQEARKSRKKVRKSH